MRGEHAAADLTEISSTVSNQDDKNNAKIDNVKTSPKNGLSAEKTGNQADVAMVTGTPHISQDRPHRVAHHCVLTDMPKFLISYIPQVS